MANMLRRLTSLNRIRMGMVQQVYGSHYCDAPDMPYCKTANWIGELKNPDLSLANITIPGTHDSMTSTCTDWRTWSVCQSMCLADQLQLGIRYLDLRCRELDQSLSIYHGPISANQTLRICIEKMTIFLKDNDKECLLVRVKRQRPSASMTIRNKIFGIDETKRFCKLFTEDLKNYENFFWRGDTIPTVKEAAGKIVILRDFILEPGTIPQGLPYDRLRIEDNFCKMFHSDRYKLTQKHLEKAEKCKNKQTPDFFLTHSSAVIGVRSPRVTARKINPLLNNYIKNKQGRFGIIAMDFPEPELIENIINTNSFK